MANKTVTLNSYVFNGRTGLTMLLLHPSTGAIGNGAGDALTPGSNGHFSTVVTEAITGAWRIVVLDGSTPLIEDEWVYFPSDVEGTYPATGMRLDIYNAISDVETPVYFYPTELDQSKRHVNSEIEVFTDETGSQFFFAKDATGAALDLTGRTLEFRIADSVSKTRLYTAKTSDGTLTISLGNKVTFTRAINYTKNSNASLQYSLRDVNAGNETLLKGNLKVTWAP